MLPTEGKDNSDDENKKYIFKNSFNPFKIMQKWSFVHI